MFLGELCDKILCKSITHKGFHHWVVDDSNLNSQCKPNKELTGNQEIQKAQNRVHTFENPQELLKLAEAITTLPEAVKRQIMKLAGRPNPENPKS